MQRPSCSIRRRAASFTLPLTSTATNALRNRTKQTSIGLCCAPTADKTFSRDRHADGVAAAAPVLHSTVRIHWTLNTGSTTQHAAPK